MLRVCRCCKKEFNNVNGQRQYCYECLPNGLTPAETEKARRRLRQRMKYGNMTCPRCQKTFAVEYGDVNREYCYECMPKGIDKAEGNRRAKYYAKEKAVAFLGGKCSKCGYDKSFVALEFHHLIPHEKEHDPSNKLNSIKQFEKYKSEIEKCILLCANCHKVEHFGKEEFKLK